ncbi:DUF3108 domain-containing protein [bacterium]|nr:DUF3108 domain-containing protein [bacterium]
MYVIRLLIITVMFLGMSAPFSVLPADSEAEPLILPGEKLRYSMYLFGRLLKVGEAEFTTAEQDQDGRALYIFTGSGTGGYLFYTVVMTLRSITDQHTQKPLTFEHLQSGFEKRCRKLVFDWDNESVVYYRKKNLRDDYYIKAVSPISSDTRDILSTVYFARSMPPEIGSSQVMRFIEKRDIWTVSITVKDKQPLALQGDKKVNALLLSIRPHHDLHEGNEVLRALFSGRKEIGLWVSEKYRIPLMIEGNLPYKWLPIPFSIILTEWQPADRVETE